MKINWTVRMKNPLWWVQIALAVLTPILAYAGLTMADMTTWAALGGLLAEAAGNPYVLGLAAVSVWNAINDPTTKGVSDDAEVMQLTKPWCDK